MIPCIGSGYRPRRQQPGKTSFARCRDAEGHKERFLELFLTNIASPPLLFFFLGLMAALLRSDLDVPASVAKFLSLYLLFAIGFKGGVALSEARIDFGVASSLVAALGLAIVAPLLAFAWLRRRLGTADAAALAATYGSVSAVTFVTCASYLDAAGISWSGHLVAAMAIMESPAIMVGILLYRHFSSGGKTNGGSSGAEIAREAFLNGSVFLIIGSLLIGWVTGPAGMAQVGPLVKDLFTGVLCLFLLDMGLVAAQRLRDLRDPGLIAFGLLFPLVMALLSASIGIGIGLSEGDALLLTVLGASASYIAVPAAMRLALPDANPGLYLPLSLALTFPMNLIVGIPIYHLYIRSVMSL